MLRSTRSTKRIIHWLCRKKIIKQQDMDVYAYGIQNLLIFLFNLFSFMVIGAIFHTIMYTVVFILFYSVLRIYAGGYHASTAMRCYFISNVIVLMFIILFKNLPINNVVSCISAFCCYTYIFMFAPVDTQNKHLDQLEKKCYGKRARIVLSIELLVQQFSLWTGQQKLSTTIMFSLCAVCIMMLIGQGKNRYNHRKPV